MVLGWTKLIYLYKNVIRNNEKYSDKNILKKFYKKK